MRGLHFRPRSELRPGSRPYTAGIGLRYAVPYDRTITHFFNDVDSRWAALLRPLNAVGNTSGRTDKNRFTLYGRQFNDVLPADPILEEAQLAPGERYLGRLTVAELRVSSREAKRYGITWATTDSGRMRGELVDGVARLRQDHGLPLGDLTLQLTNVVPVGQRQGRKGNRKFALTPPADDRVAAFLAEAHGFVIDKLAATVSPKTRLFPGKAMPLTYSEGVSHTDDEPTEGALNQLVDTPWLPHLTIGYVHAEVPRERVADCARVLMETVAEAPLAVRLAGEEVYDLRSLRTAY
jgi:hypothetical protein